MAAPSSFDVVSDFDRQELVNAIDQLKREIVQRYDLKDTNSEVKLEETSLTITTESDLTLQAIEDVLRQKAVKRNLSLKIFEFETPEASAGNRVIQKVLLKKDAPIFCKGKATQTQKECSKKRFTSSQVLEKNQGSKL